MGHQGFPPTVTLARQSGAGGVAPRRGRGQAQTQEQDTAVPFWLCYFLAGAPSWRTEVPRSIPI